MVPKLLTLNDLERPLPIVLYVYLSELSQPTTKMKTEPHYKKTNVARGLVSDNLRYSRGFAGEATMNESEVENGDFQFFQVLYLRKHQEEIL